MLQKAETVGIETFYPFTSFQICGFKSSFWLTALDLLGALSNIGDFHAPLNKNKTMKPQNITDKSESTWLFLKCIDHPYWLEPWNETIPSTAIDTL